jgi:hypothetical protein
MARGRRSYSQSSDNGDSTTEAVAAVRPTSVEEAARPLNPDYVPRYEDGSEKPKWKWSVLEQELYQANHSTPEAIRMHTDHLGPSSRVGLDPRGPIVASGTAPEGEAFGSSDLTVPTGKPGEEKMEEQDQQGDTAVMEAKQK